MADITLQDIYRARRRIAPIASKTPLLESPAISSAVGASVFLKPELLQQTGSFKIRGAANKILSLSAAERELGVITASTGNHGRAVAYVAHQLGVQATVCLSEAVPENKVAALRNLGADVVIHGHSQDDSFRKAQELRQKQGLVFVPPFDDGLIIAGQGTIGLELIEDLPDVETVLVPVSGGGLISGIAKALKSASPEIMVIGVSMERSPVMYHSLRAGKPLEMEEKHTLADSLRGGIGLDNRHTFSMLQKYVDGIVLVSEEQIAAAMSLVFYEHHFVLEGAGAVGIAALLSEKAKISGKKVVVLLSGGNVDLPTFLQIIKRHRSE
ncbi:MAG TPA: hydroxyectoine utilization dehydratase EutB [Anaerolineales bacterium]|jgi:threonine dehydratase|nr:hydroxyectoine utilization dehydratase EutB [Anaerolineales bacterium]